MTTVAATPPVRAPGLVPPLAPGVVQVWSADVVDVTERHTPLLGPAERARRAAMRNPAARDRSTAGAVLLRLLVGQLTGVDPAAVQVDRTCAGCGRQHGRPTLAGGLRCSVSHTGATVWVAVARGVDIGVDIEQEPSGDVAPFARLAMTDAEYRSLLDRDPAERPAAFCVSWTRKEAVLKASGHGLRYPLRLLELSGPDEPPVVRRGGPDGPVQLVQLRAPAGHAACLAWRGSVPPVVWQYDAVALLAQFPATEVSHA